MKASSRREAKCDGQVLHGITQITNVHHVDYTWVDKVLANKLQSLKSKKSKTTLSSANQLEAAVAGGGGGGVTVDVEERMPSGEIETVELTVQVERAAAKEHERESMASLQERMAKRKAARMW